MRILALLLISVSLLAHDLYLYPESFRPAPGATVRLEYHNGDSFPVSEMPVKADRLLDAQLLAGGEATPFSNFRIDGPATVADFVAPSRAGNFILISRTKPNFIRLNPAKFKEYLQHEGLDKIIAWREDNGESDKPGREIYSKYVKALGLVGSPSPDYGAVAGLAIEFVPLANPYELSPGSSLPVRVLFRGKPATGLAIEMSNSWADEVTNSRAGRTDENGEIQIPVNGPGLWKLHTVHMERFTDAEDADWQSFWASLTFEVPGAAK